jgi:hypothetical protein
MLIYDKSVASSLLEVTSTFFRVSFIDKEINVLQIGQWNLSIHQCLLLDDLATTFSINLEFKQGMTSSLI